MSQRHWIPLGVLLLALLGGGLGQALRQSAPRYHGRPLTFWLKGFDLGYCDPAKPSWDESVEAVRQAGARALPLLLRMLRANDSDLKHKLIRLAQKQRLVRIDYVSADRERWAARQGFMALLGRKARGAVPQLTEISREEVAGAYAVPGGGHTEYATEILELLKQTDESVRAAGKAHPEAVGKADGK